MKYLFSAKGYRKLRSESQIKNRISEIEDDWKRIRKPTTTLSRNTSISQKTLRCIGSAFLGSQYFVPESRPAKV
jgi:hypothetical protein